MIAAADTNKDGEIDFDEFAALWWRREQANHEKEFDDVLKIAFGMFDTDGSGKVSLQELRLKLTTLGDKMSDEEVNSFLAEADLDHSGSITMEEFRGLRCWH